MNVRALSAWCLAGSAAAFACANEPPTSSSDGDPAKTHVVVSVDRTDSSSDAPGSASAMARFVSVPAFSDASRVLTAAGATLDLPAADTCQTSGGQEDLEPPLPSQGPVELLEAGDVAITAGDSTTPLVPHAFPTVGGFASGVLYATKDRTEGALPSAVPYAIQTTGSDTVPALHLVAEAPRTPTNVSMSGTTLRETTEAHTARPMDFTWLPGDAGDLVYVELLAYDGSASVLCTFRDEAGTGTIPANAFQGTGSGRIAVHRQRSRHVETVTGQAAEIHFDFQVGVSLDFAK
ncbi:MAG TPA: hypothetical protein VHE30_16365 [Polyangiaceae bacterium]|nr:hypothetical protein [Polyangiaceae bacterium]